MKHVMLDLETMGVRAGCAIASIGACDFNPVTGEIGNTFYEVIELQSCFNVGLKCQASTLYWWLEQSAEARAAIAVAERRDLSYVLTLFKAWMGTYKDTTIWANGSNFDFPILELAFAACRLKPTWEYHRVRDARTIYKMAGVYAQTNKGTPHHALDDCKNQVARLVWALSQLELTAV